MQDENDTEVKTVNQMSKLQKNMNIIADELLT